MNFNARLILTFILFFNSGCLSDSQEKAASNTQERDLVIFQDCELDCPIMRLIPKGKFMMGVLPYDEDATKWEKPYHPVEIKNDFYMSMTEITYGYYMLCVEEGGCDYTPTNEFDQCMLSLYCEVWYRMMSQSKKNFRISPGLQPVTGISINDAKQYTAWLSNKTGQVYRLPTEEEWEYAARGGTETIFWWGDKMEPGRTYCSGCNANMPSGRIPLNFGNYPGNSFGLHDMLGNAAELVGSCFVDNSSQKLDAVTRGRNECERFTIKGGG